MEFQLLLCQTWNPSPHALLHGSLKLNTYRKSHTSSIGAFDVQQFSTSLFSEFLRSNEKSMRMLAASTFPSDASASAKRFCRKDKMLPWCLGGVANSQPLHATKVQRTDALSVFDIRQKPNLTNISQTILSSHSRNNSSRDVRTNGHDIMGKKILCSVVKHTCCKYGMDSSWRQSIECDPRQARKLYRK